MRFAAVALLAFTACKRPEAPAAVVTAKAIAAPSEEAIEARDAARDAAADEALSLPPALIDRVATFAERAQGVREPEALCKLLPEAFALRRALQGPLGARFEKTFDTPEADKLATALDDLGDALPLLSIDQHVAGPAVAVDLAAMAERIGMATPGGKLLDAAAQVVAAPAFERVTDDQSCLEQTKGVPAVRALAAAWPGGPPCLREALRSELKRSLDGSVGGAYCSDEREKVIAEADAYASALEALPDLGGPELAKAARAAARAEDARLGFEGE